MFDVLLYLFENYFNPEACPNPDQLTRKLSAVGFEREDIDEALDWLTKLSEATHAAPPVGMSEDASRVYAHHEYETLGSEAIGFLAFLDAAGVLMPVLRELIIDRAMSLGEAPVPLEKLKVVVLMILWSQEAEVDALILEELLDEGGARELH
jgi:Smg protein